jgi:hypothetical protein
MADLSQPRARARSKTPIRADKTAGVPLNQWLRLALKLNKSELEAALLAARNANITSVDEVKILHANAKLGSVFAPEVVASIKAYLPKKAPWSKGSSSSGLLIGSFALFVLLVLGGISTLNMDDSTPRKEQPTADEIFMWTGIKEHFKKMKEREPSENEEAEMQQKFALKVGKPNFFHAVSNLASGSCEDNTQPPKTAAEAAEQAADAEEAEEKLKQEVDRKAKQEATEKAKQAAEERAKQEAEEKAKQEAERALQEIEEEAKREAEKAKAKQEADEEKKTKQEETEKTKQETAKKAKEADAEVEAENAERAKQEVKDAEESATKEAEEATSKSLLGAEGQVMLTTHATSQKDERSDPSDITSDIKSRIASLIGPRLFTVGERIEGNWLGHGDWYDGKVAYVEETTKAGTPPLYTILYDDGESEEKVPTDRLRLDIDVNVYFDQPASLIGVLVLVLVTTLTLLLYPPARERTYKSLVDDWQITLWKFLPLLIAVAVAFYAGIDVIPGEFEHGVPTIEHNQTDFDLGDIFEGQDKVIRLRRADGYAISEEDEEKLIPLLEALDRSLEMAAMGKAGQAGHTEAIRDRIKALNIYSDAEVDAIQSRAGITHILMQMEATVPMWRHIFRGMVATVFIFGHDLVWSGHPFPALAIELMLPFAPVGHPETTAGRHFDGGRTWVGLRRFDLGLILLLQIILTFVVHNLGALLLMKIIRVDSKAIKVSAHTRTPSHPHTRTHCAAQLSEYISIL